MESKFISTENLRVIGRRRRWIPGKIAVWVFLSGMNKVWPFNHIWTTPKGGSCGE